MVVADAVPPEKTYSSASKKSVTTGPLPINVAEIEMPPSETYSCAAELISDTGPLPDTTVPLAMPPDPIICEPPPETLSVRALPKTFSSPPLLIVAALSKPPAETVSSPPLLTVVLLAVPPDSTSIVSLELRMMPVLVCPALIW